MPASAIFLREIDFPAPERISQPAVLLLSAHPDDETIGAGVWLSRTKNVRVVHATNGSPLDLSDALAAGFATREDYSSARKHEVICALHNAGIAEDSIGNLGFTDQRAAFSLEELTHRILGLLRQNAPEILLTHAYEGGHPDHDSVAFAAHMAWRLYRVETARQIRSTELFEFACYNAREGQLRANEFIPYPDAREYELRLTLSEQRLKQRMFDAFESQARTLQWLCPPEIERFRRAPEYDFRLPPHHGNLFYENFDWGIDGRYWRDLALKAQHHLHRQEEHSVSHDS